MQRFCSCNQACWRCEQLRLHSWRSKCKSWNVWFHFMFNTTSGTEETSNEPDISTKDLPNTKTTTFGSKDICIMIINRIVDRTITLSAGQVPGRLLHKYGTGLRLYQSRVATDVSGCHFSGATVWYSSSPVLFVWPEIDLSTYRHGLPQRFGFFRLPRGITRRLELLYQINIIYWHHNNSMFTEHYLLLCVLMKSRA
jgi:hypothetical protein